MSFPFIILLFSTEDSGKRKSLLQLVETEQKIEQLAVSEKMNSDNGL